MDKFIEQIPNIGLHNFLEIGDKSLIERSETDDEKRRFSISIGLEDLRARTQHVQISFDKIDFHIKDEDGDTIDHWLEKTSNNLLKSILIGVQKNNPQAALRAMDGILPLLSILSFKLRRPIGIRTVTLKDLKNNAEWRSLPTTSIPVEIFQIPFTNFKHAVPFCTMFALYREGMNWSCPC